MGTPDPLDDASDPLPSPADGPDAADPTTDGEPEDKLFDAGSIVEAMGGARGLLEASIPGVVFATAYAISGAKLGVSVWIAVASAAVILVVALVQRRSVQQTVTGFIGILFGAGIVLITGRARDFFAISLVRNGAWLAAHAISMLVLWPLIGLIVGPFTGEGTAWRKDKARLRAYMWCTGVWVLVFAIRLAVQIPLYLDDKVVELGFVGVLLGLPLFFAACGLNYLILRRVPLAVRRDADDDGSSDDHRPDDPHPPIIAPG
jgi:hypothetical protein